MLRWVASSERFDRYFYEFAMHRGLVAQDALRAREGVRATRKSPDPMGSTKHSDGNGKQQCVVRHCPAPGRQLPLSLHCRWRVAERPGVQIPCGQSVRRRGYDSRGCLRLLPILSAPFYRLLTVLSLARLESQFRAYALFAFLAASVWGTISARWKYFVKG